MNQNNIHDALNMLDDAMIDAVDVLRKRPFRIKKDIQRFGSLVAVLCLCFVGIVAMIPTNGTKNDASSIQYGYQEENLSCSDSFKAESSVEDQSNSIIARVRIVEFTDNGFVAEVIESYDVLDGAVSGCLTVIYTNSITEEFISRLKVGDIVDVQYSCDPKTGTRIYARSIEHSPDE